MRKDFSWEGREEMEEMREKGDEVGLEKRGIH